MLCVRLFMDQIDWSQFKVFLLLICLITVGFTGECSISRVYYDRFIILSMTFVVRAA